MVPTHVYVTTTHKRRFHVERVCDLVKTAKVQK